MLKWVVAIFSVVGAFILSGIGGVFLAELIGVWVWPFAGFCSAFSVIAVGYLSVPKYHPQILSVVFFMGSIIAWILLEPSYYPEQYGDKAYQPTHIPFAATVSGGLIALLMCLLPLGPKKKPNNCHKAERNLTR